MGVESENGVSVSEFGVEMRQRRARHAQKLNLRGDAAVVGANVVVDVLAALGGDAGDARSASVERRRKKGSLLRVVTRFEFAVCVWDGSCRRLELVTG